MKRIISTYLVVLSAAIFTACHVHDSPEPLEYAYDIFGMNFTINKQIYLANNLWYEYPMNINAINYQTGKILPFGTEVEFVEAKPNSQLFKIKGSDDKYFNLVNDPSMTLKQDVEMYHDLLTIKNPMSSFNGVSQEIIDKLKKGNVEPGMTRTEVRCAMGPPPKEINPLSQTTWAYYVNRNLKVIHVIFRDDIVTFVF